MTAPSRLRRLAQNATLGLASLLVALAGLEAAFRLAGYLGEERRFEQALENTRPVQPGVEVGLGEIIRRSPHPKIVYELLPDLSVSFLGARLTTNGRGFRDRERPAGKPPGTSRVVGIGDSVMFGWGLDDDGTYLAQLEDVLNTGDVGTRWEVVNMAVPGYNGVMEVEALKAYGLAFEPDVVVVGFCGNDLKLPAFIWSGEDSLSLDESFLLRFVRQRLGDAPEGDFDIGLEPPQDRKGDSRLAWEGKELPNVPARYVDLVGKKAYRRSMEELAELSREHGFDVLVVAVPGIPRRARELFEGLDFDLVDTQSVFDRYIHDHAIEDWRGSVLAVDPADPHPSKLANSMVARCLRDAIVARSVPRLSAAVRTNVTHGAR